MRPLSCAILIAALAGCGRESQPTQPLAAVTQGTLSAQYTVVKLPTLGGTSRGMAINRQGWVAGFSIRPDGSRQAVLWRNDSIIPLGTLGGPNSTVPWPGLNDEGMIVGISQTGELDSLGEAWSCELGNFLPATDPRQACRGYAWADGVMQPLPTLGGTHGFAAGVNNLGQVVGWAEAAVRDTTCTDAQLLRFRAVVWDPKKNRVKTQELQPFPGDAASAATAINDDGVAVGISGRCDQAVGRYTAIRAVRWDKSGKVSEIPNLKGVTWHTPMDINRQGDVVGFSNPPGEDPEGSFIAHAFFWMNGATIATEIKPLPGDFFGQAFAINSRQQVVGVSFGGPNGAHAFIWQDGISTDLNDLMGTGNLDVFISAQDINEAGQITGRVLDHVTGKVLAFVATPVTAAP